MKKKPFPLDKDAQFSIFIKQKIKEKHIKQGVIAEDMGMSQCHLSEKLNCWQRFSMEQAQQICEILGVEFVIGRKEQK